MRRIQLPEIEDQAWCPRWLRDAMTGYLQVIIEKARPYEVAVPILAELLEQASSDQVVDLASGAGGPWPGMLPALRRMRPALSVRLTDLNPNARGAGRTDLPPGLTFVPESVPADSVSRELGGVRTMFTTLHHFDVSQVRRILASAQRDRVGFAAFEATQRSAAGLATTLVIPLIVLVLMPWVRPRRLVPLLLTYLPPLLPLLIWWDGLASTLRTYSPEELRAITEEIAEPGYAWSVEEVRVRGAPIPILQLVGRPVGPLTRA
jgi:hypothetical protein